jgi:hypothetical protein
VVQVRSIDVDGAGRVLLATAGGEVAVLVPSTGDLSLLLQGHAARRGAAWPGTLAALATHPAKPIAATAGAEGALRLWALDQHTLLGARPLPAPAAAAAFSPDGAVLAVGLADGGWLLLDAESLKPTDGAAAAAAPMAERAARGAVGCLTFSPDGAMLAIGGSDGAVTIVAHAAGGWRVGWHRVTSAVGHTSGVCQIDWSEEPVVLTSGVNVVGSGSATECWLLRSSAAPAAAPAQASEALVNHGHEAPSSVELIHWEIMCDREAGARSVSSAGARRVAHATAVRDVSWASDTCALCWGALAPTMREGLALGGASSSVRPVCRSHEGEVLAASDARGGVSLWRWPAAAVGGLSKRYGGHARSPAALAFSFDDGCLLTCGATAHKAHASHWIACTLLTDGAARCVVQVWRPRPRFAPMAPRGRGGTLT